MATQARAVFASLQEGVERLFCCIRVHPSDQDPDDRPPLWGDRTHAALGTAGIRTDPNGKVDGWANLCQAIQPLAFDPAA